MSSWVLSGFDAARWTRPPPAVSTPTRTAVSAVTCRQAAIERPSNGRVRAYSCRSRPSTGIERSAHAILAAPVSASPGSAMSEANKPASVAVVVGFVRAGGVDADVVGLLLAEFGQLD